MMWIVELFADWIIGKRRAEIAQVLQRDPVDRAVAQDHAQWELEHQRWQGVSSASRHPEGAAKPDATSLPPR